jgi:branched-subunit amino acid ABC-type transport system permease component
LLPFIIAGLTAGSVYGLAGTGLVLTYKTSGVFNFAYGALATVSAYLFYTLYVQLHVAWWIAAAICVLILGPGIGFAFELITRRLARRSLAVRVASTVGVLLIIQALAVIIYGTTVTRTVPPFLGNHGFHIGRAVVTSDQIVVFGVGVVATVALYLMFRFTRSGVAMRAVVEDPDLLNTVGTNPVRVRRAAWAIGSSFATLSGLLLVPFINLDSITLTFLVVAAFGAAAIGGFSSLPGTYVGGLVIGLLASLSTKYFTTGLLSGLATSLPFLVLFVVLLLAPRRRLAERVPLITQRTASWTAPWQLQSTSGAVLLIVLVLVPNFAGLHLGDYTRFLGIAVVFLSLGLLVRTSGQVSLSHVSFMAIGVCAFSHLQVDHHWPWLLALLAAGVIAVPIGALLAIPAIRLPGLYLALATFGFGILLQYMFYTQDYMFGSLGLGVSLPAPVLNSIGLSGSPNSYYYFALVIAVVCTAVVVLINRSRLGRLLRALGDSPVGLATSGTSVRVTRVLVFCISAFLAAVGGVLEAASIGQVGGDSYQPIMSLTFFALIVISLGGAPWYAIAAAAGWVIIPSYVSDPNISNWLQVAFGAAAVLYSVTPASKLGTPPAIQAAVDRIVRRRQTSQRDVTADSAASAASRYAEPSVSLQVDNMPFNLVRAPGMARVHHPECPLVAGKAVGPAAPGDGELCRVCEV